jgi:hypothetical protein
LPSNFKLNTSFALYSAKAIKKKPDVKPSDPMVQTGPSKEATAANPDIPDEPAVEPEPASHAEPVVQTKLPPQDTTAELACTSPNASQERADMIEEHPAENTSAEVVVTGECQNLPLL